MRKPEFTLVNEDFRGKHNAEFTLLRRPLFVGTIVALYRINRNASAYEMSKSVIISAGFSCFFGWRCGSGISADF